MRDDNRSLAESLSELRKMVRTWSSATMGVSGDISKVIEASIRDLKKARKQLNPIQLLTLKTLECDYVSQNGRFLDALKALGAVGPKLERRLNGCATNDYVGFREDQPGSDPRDLLRQELLALLFYIYNRYHKEKRQDEEAIRLLMGVSRVIRNEFMVRSRENPSTNSGKIPHHPAGTLTFCHLFLGSCYRELRQFDAAEKHFLLAQQENARRLERQMGDIRKRAQQTSRARDRESNEREFTAETLYANVCTARIHAALSFLSIHKGRLLRAEHGLFAAKTLLMPTGYRPLKLYVESLLWMTIRRRMPIKSAAYQNALKALEKCYEELSGDPSGQRTCAREIARGYLDLAEFEPSTAGAHLNKASEWLSHLEEIAAKNSQADKERFRVRLSLLRIRFYILGDLDKAGRLIDELNKEHGHIDHESAKLLHLFTATLYMKQGKHAEAIECLKLAGRKMATNVIDGEIVRDPVFESEVCLLTARIHSDRKNIEESNQHLAQWSVLSHFVENYYFHHQAAELKRQNVALGQMADHVVPFTVFADPNPAHKIRQLLKSHDEEFRKWLVAGLRIQLGHRPTVEEMVQWFGVSRSTVKRNFKGLID